MNIREDGQKHKLSCIATLFLS